MGGSDDLLNQLKLHRDLDRYSYLTNGKTANVDIQNGEILNYLDDKSNFELMLKALKICEFSDQQTLVLV